MSEVRALEAAVERGKNAAPSSRFEPVGVEYRGRLIAVVKDKRVKDGTVEKVFEHQGKLFFYQLGQRADGTVTLHSVTDRSLKKIVSAMFGKKGDERDELIRAGYAEMQKRSNGNGSRPARKRRRKK